MNKLKNGLYRFMSGRYGWDQFGTFLITIGFILDVIGLFTNISLLAFIAEFILLYEIIRMFSRNITVRSRENNWFINLTRKPRHHFMTIQKGHKDKANKYYVCPKCGQIVRIPKGHGKVEIHCPKCSHTFTRKS